MIATESSCLTPEQLRDVAGGRLPAHRFSRLLEHLDSCPECQNRAEAAFESDDSLAAALAAPSAADPHAAEPDCVAALHHVANRRDLPAERSSPPVDQLGPYKLIRPLGSGGMGAVFLAEHTRLRRRCAIKLLPRDRGFDAAWRDRFDREMAAVAALDDPHVVSASDAGEAAGWHFLVMEYLDGLDLSRLAGRLGPLGIADGCELVRQAAVGLAHIHASGLVHRDIKPSNLMLMGAKSEAGEMGRIDPEMRQLYDAMGSAVATLKERAAAAASDTEPDANGGSEEAEAPADPGAAGQFDNVDPRHVEYAERIISRYDENGDSVLTEDERKEMIIDVSPADADRDGRITIAEYAAWFQARSGARQRRDAGGDRPQQRRED